MTAAILHYHLDVGGVSSVIAAQSRAMLRAGVRHLVFCGQPVNPVWQGLPVVVIPELGYRNAQEQPKAWKNEARRVVAIMQRECRERLGGEPEVWHVHNSGLARHPLLPHVVEQLALSQKRLWMHPHDFAEAGRPCNLARLGKWRNLYPVGPGILYRFLSQRDRARLVHCGLPESCAHVIPNPIELPPPSGTPARNLSPSDDIRQWMLYPVRGIRRKNLGETLLLASLLPETWGIAVTRPPGEAQALARYNAWRDVAARMDLPVEFSVVGRLHPGEEPGTDIETWRAASAIWLNTSVEEGFGLVFAEAWMHEKPLIGRRLEHLDGSMAGRRWYDRILIPSEWLGKQSLGTWREQTWWALLQAHGYQEQEPPGFGLRGLRMMMEAGITGTCVDFGNLPECLQQRVLEHLQCFPEQQERILATTPNGAMPLHEWLSEACSLLAPDPAGTCGGPHWQNGDSFWQQLRAAESTSSCGAPTVLSWLDASKVLERCLLEEPRHSTDRHDCCSDVQPFHFLLAPGLDEGGFPEPGNADLVVFDVYGTLLRGAPGGVRNDKEIDPLLERVLMEFGFNPPPGNYSQA